jgi:hypothetical protein
MAGFSASLRQTPDGSSSQKIIFAATGEHSIWPFAFAARHQQSPPPIVSQNASAISIFIRCHALGVGIYAIRTDARLDRPSGSLASLLQEYSAGEQGAMRPISCAVVALSLPLGPIGRATLAILTAGSFPPRLVIAFAAIRTST